MKVIDQVMADCTGLVWCNKWVKDHTIKLYYRVTKRCVDGHTFCVALDLATIDARHPGNGAFGRLLDALLERLPVTSVEILYVETVFDDRFGSYLVRRGFARTGEHPYSYWRRV